MSAPPRDSDRHSALRRSRELVAGVVQDLADDDSAPLAGVPTATSMGVLSCHGCDALSPLADEGTPCRRCGATLHRRKPASLARTWAFLLAAYILYIPANVLPVMTTRSILGTQEDTILSGVIYLWVSGSNLLAIVVLTASIIVPLLKMAVLTFLLLSVHLRSTWRLRQQTRLYALVELIGRWSMLDIFVVALLASLVRAGALATVDPGAGAAAFGMVVVCTMLASLSFDPRLLWDNLDAAPAPSAGREVPDVPHISDVSDVRDRQHQAAGHAASRPAGTDPLH